MARIRSIKPEFPQSESMGRISREARLCFIMLWTLADDSGRLRGSSRMLASLLYPYDEDAPRLIQEWLTELVNENCIVQYQVEGQHYLQISNWLSHQKIDHPSASKFPEPPTIREDSRGFANDSGKFALDQGEDQGSRIKDQGQDAGCVREDPPLPPANLKPASGDLFASLQSGFLAQCGGRFTNPGAEAFGIRAIIDYASGNIDDLEIMIATFYRLTKSQDKFWSRQPFLPSVLAKPGIWDRVKVEARKGIEQQDTDEDCARFAAEDRQMEAVS